MKKVFSRFVCLALTLALLMGLSALPAVAKGGTVSFSCPVITAEVGQSVSLRDYSVEFTNGSARAAGEITWTSDALSIGADGSVSAATAGVFALTATAGNASRTVYLVTKNASDSEFVLYYNDFSSSDISDFTVVQQTSGAEISVENGKLVLDASSSSSNYIRILLPEWLSVFGDCKISADITMEKAASTSNWISLMARVQNNDSPYWQACLRQKATASNGTEIAERTAANKWNVTHTTACAENISASKQYTFSFELRGNTAQTALNGTPLLHSSTLNQVAGRIGLQTRGVRLLVDSIKITVPADKIEIPAANVHTTREQSTNLALTPTTVARINSASELDALGTLSPTVAMLYVNSALEVTTRDGKKLCTLAEALEKTGDNVIPAFYISDSDTVTPLCSALSTLELRDVMFAAADGELVRRARVAYPASQGILDCTAASPASTSELYALRDRANSSRARVILLSEAAATRDNTEYLQRLFMTVWCESDDSTVGYVGAITSGANGIIVSDRAKYESILTKFFDKNTLTRLTNVIAHRGSPTLSQENTIASSIIAYEKGATMIENDIYLTRDNVIVVMHDSTIDRTTNGTGKVESFTYEQLKKFSVNANTSASPEPIPTLEDYFKEFKGKDVQLVVEIKKDANAAIVSALAKLIEKYDIADQVNVITFSETFVESMRNKLPGVSVGFLTSSITPSESAPDEALEAILAKVESMATTYNPSYASGALGQKLMRRVSERGITIWPWTVNKSEDFDKYLLLGTNGITTNYSQWVTNYTRRIDAPSDEVTVTPDGVDFKLSRLTYGRARTDITNAEMVVLEDNGAGVSYSGGKLYASGTGTATVMFKLANRTNSRTTYYLCTEPVMIKTAKSTDTSAADTTPAVTTPTDTTPADTTPAAITPADTTTNASGGGCGSIMALALLAAVIPAALALRKKD